MKNTSAAVAVLSAVLLVSAAPGFAALPVTDRSPKVVPGPSTQALETIPDEPQPGTDVLELAKAALDARSSIEQRKDLEAGSQVQRDALERADQIRTTLEQADGIAAVRPLLSSHQLDDVTDRTHVSTPTDAERQARLLSEELPEATPEDLSRRTSSLDALGSEMQESLARLLHSYRHLAQATERYAASANLEGIAQSKGPAVSLSVDEPIRPSHGLPPSVSSPHIPEDLIVARDRVLSAIMDLQEAQQEASTAAQDVEACPLLAIDLDGSDDEYTKPCAVIVDTGGEDRYRNNAGGNNWVQGSCSTDRLGRAGLLVDLGGSDLYQPNPGSCGVNGGANGGVGLLVDTSGSDRYEAASNGANGGAASGGVGALIDLAGSDQYHAGAFGTNGGATMAGSGQLVDLAGSDTYRAAVIGVNGGAVVGEAALIDRAGNDTYQAAGGGANGGSAVGGHGFLLDHRGSDAYHSGSSGSNGGGSGGGVGFLLDSMGDDTYEGGQKGINGGGFFPGLGTLLDGGGDDLYKSAGFGTNGGAACAAAGLLIDRAGTDRYQASRHGANGGAWCDGGLGFLWDRGGSDVYRAEDLGTNGGSAANAVAGALVDTSGDDTYIGTRDGVNGGADPGLRDTGGVGALVDRAGDDLYRVEGQASSNGGADTGGGLLADLGGTDRYQDSRGSCTDCSQAPKGQVGAQADVSGPEAILFPGAETELG